MSSVQRSCGLNQRHGPRWPHVSFPVKLSDFKFHPSIFDLLLPLQYNEIQFFAFTTQPRSDRPLTTRTQKPSTFPKWCSEPEPSPVQLIRRHISILPRGENESTDGGAASSFSSAARLLAFISSLLLPFPQNVEWQRRCWEWKFMQGGNVVVLPVLLIECKPPCKTKDLLLPITYLAWCKYSWRGDTGEEEEKKKEASGHSVEWIRLSLAVLLQKQQLAAQLGGNKESVGDFSLPFRGMTRESLSKLCCVFLPQSDAFSNLHK